MNLKLQREILDAIDAKDEQALKDIAVREGIDPDLWEYWFRAMQVIETVNAAGARP